MQLFIRYSIFCLLGFANSVSVAQTLVASGFEKIVSEIGVDLYHREANNVYVQIVDLREGAKVEIKVNEIEGEEYSDAHETVMEFERVSVVDTYYNLTGGEWSTDDHGYFSVMNAGEFESYFGYTELTNSVVVGKKYYLGKKGLDYLSDKHTPRILQFNNDQGAAKIKEISLADPNASRSLSTYLDIDIPYALVGMFQSMNTDDWEDSEDEIDRTAVGVIDKNGDDIGDGLILLVGEELTRPEVARIIKEFGVIDKSGSDDKFSTKMRLMMLDSGGSSQLFGGYKNEQGHRTPFEAGGSRKIPEYLAVSKGEIFDWGLNNICSNYGWVPFDDNGGLLPHEWGDTGIVLQNCKHKYEARTGAVFRKGISTGFSSILVRDGFWEYYKKDSFGVNNLGSPLGKETEVSGISCQEFENGVLIWLKTAGARHVVDEGVNCGNYMEYEINTCFSDVYLNTPYAEEICNLKEKKIVDGYGDGSFGPGRELTRAELLKVVLYAQYSEAVIDGASGGLFSDVETDSWYVQHVRFAKEKNIISGYPDGTFRGDKPIEYSEAAKIIVNTLIEHTEVGSSIWYRPFIFRLELDAPNDFIPSKKLTRGEMAYLINSVL